MDVFERLYHILQANLATGARPAFEEQVPGYQAGSRQRETPVEVDPRLAGYYANLEIPYGADLAEARRAWKRLLKHYHPDLYASDPDKRRLASQLTTELTVAFQEIEAALTNKEKP
jgi:DnaJ-domain-containing protein 1